MVVFGRSLALAVLVIGCDSPCAEVADRLRDCCARGPAELRASCEDEARELEEDGNADACESALQHGSFPGCGQ